MRDHEYQKTCPECMQEFTASRVDQVYCNRKCLNGNKNRIARQKRKQVISIDKTLHKNRDILRDLAARSKDGIVSKDELLFRDFNFRFHTHTLKDSKTEITYFFTYEYGFAPMEDNRYKLIRHEPKI